MTIQTEKAFPSKKALKEALEANPKGVWFIDPSLFSPRADGSFNGEEIAEGESLPVVLNHPQRTRFAVVKRGADGRFKVL